MKRLVRTMLLSTLAMSTLTPTFAQEPVAPTVPRGSFHCFRGMPLSDINYVDDNSARPNIFRAGPKLGNSKWDNTDGHDLREVLTEGKLKVMVIIVNFEDTQFSQKSGDPNALITEMLNGDNFTYQNATGSANQYYRTISNGKFDPQFDVYGPINLSKPSVEYVTPQETPATNPDGYYIDPATGKQVQKYPASRAVEEAIMAIKDQVNFADYDSNGDGYVDFVYMFYAGKGATTGGGRYTTIWPHAFTLTSGLGAPIELNGVKIDRYACSAELGANNRLSGIGTFCHEFGHVLGLPDIYDTANNGSARANFTAGPFTCMDAGNYNNDEHTPPFFSSYEQYALEWMLPKTVTGGGHFTMLPLGARKFAYKFETSNPQEYFLMEARDKNSLDYYLPCHGLAVWHIDFNLDIWNKNTPNNNDNH
ncbi:MAG: M6 family metalloprotease domain-containing protein, partial [Muribaculaceae bacterium]|nr:M6 family metalloprotease domain-containing protein [Muribaculaceae bacterium]